MSTRSAPTTIVSAESAGPTFKGPNLRRGEVWDRRFFVAMALVSTLCVAVAFASATQLGLRTSPRPMPRLVAVHGAVYFAWMILFIVQTSLIAAGRTHTHRLLGYASGVLAALMIVMGFLVAFRAEKNGFWVDFGSRDTEFLFSLVDIMTFGAFIGLALWWRHDPETHQRLMLLAVVAGLFAAVVPRMPGVGGHPSRMAMFGYAFLLAGPIYDLIARRRIHRAYIWGCVFAIVTGAPLRLVVAATPWWHHFAKRISGP